MKMAETKDIVNSSISGILIVALLALGVSVQPEDTHYCSTLDMTMHCERLSSTEMTCYPHSDDRKGSKLCGIEWIPIIEDSASPEPEPKPIAQGQTYICPSVGSGEPCVEVK